MKGLEQSPEDRFPSAREMALAVERAVPPASATVVGDWVRRLAREIVDARAAVVARVEGMSMRPHLLASHLRKTSGAEPTATFQLSGNQASVFDEQGRVLGLVRGSVDRNAQRTAVIPAAVLLRLLAAPRAEHPYRRPHHLQSWGGLGLALHNRPTHLGTFATWGLRVVLWDSLRLEPWIEGLVGTRAPFQCPEGDYRPHDLWWSLDLGFSAGWRVPVAVEGSRDYVVPNVGLRLGWNRFGHRRDELLAVCDEGAPCRWVLDRSLDEERDLRVGIDLGLDIRHGAVRLGYRFFLSPSDLGGESMHRLVLTFDGLGLPIHLGDSH
jgi:hypothetical protein